MISINLGKATDPMETNDKKSEGQVETWGTLCSLTMPGKSNQLESWGTLWDPSQQWTPSLLSNKDLPKNKPMIIPGSGKAMNNIGKVVRKLDYVSKTETNNVMNNFW